MQRRLDIMTSEKQANLYIFRENPDTTPDMGIACSLGYLII